MDVSQPNNWPRVEELFRRKIWRLNELGYAAVTDETTKETMRELKAWAIPLNRTRRLLTARCATSCSRVNTACSSAPRIRRSSKRAWKRSCETLPLPKELAERADLPLLSHNLPADFAALRKLMMG
jgi:threonine synthase